MNEEKINQKDLDLDSVRVSHGSGNLTTNQGVGISNTNDIIIYSL